MLRFTHGKYTIGTHHTPADERWLDWSRLLSVASTESLSAAAIAGTPNHQQKMAMQVGLLPEQGRGFQLLSYPAALF